MYRRFVKLSRRWPPDKGGLIRAAVGLVVAVTKTALPLAAAVDFVLAMTKLDESDLEAWHDRLLDGIKRWADGHPGLIEPVGGLPTGWQSAFLKELQAIGASSLLGSDPRTREVVEEVLARTAFLPLIATDVGWEASRAAAHRLAEDLPGLLVEAAGPQSGLAACLQILRSDLDEILTKLTELTPLSADQVVCEAYLNVVIDELDHDPWTRMAGGRESSLTSIARRLPVIARADTGYGVGGEQTVTGDALELAARCERLVLLGGPGAGKTWLARRIVIDAAGLALGALTAETDPPTVEIPLFARCTAVFGSDRPVWEAVVVGAFAQIGHRFGSDQLTAALKRRFLQQRGRFLVVLDGLDEADHLPGGDALDRLAATAERELRIVLTSRPASWRRQLPLGRRNDRHRVAELEPLDYPEDVLGVIDVWLAGRPAARAGLIARLEDSPELAQAVQTPLLCAMHCLLAEVGDGLPVTGGELWARVVTRLLEGMWRYHHLDDQKRVVARRALRELAWAGADTDPVTGLSAWPEMVQHTFEPVLADVVESAVSHVAPAAPYDPDTAEPARQFLHPSIREHLVAQHVAALPAAEARDAIEPHLWYDPRWEQVLPSAIAAHPQRDTLLHAVIDGDGRVADLRLALDRRDGFGELRRLLARLATETSPNMWSAVHVRLIDDACRSLHATGHAVNWLAAAVRGWPGARPGSRELADLLAGHVPWKLTEIGAWTAYLDLTPADRHQVIQALVDVLRVGMTKERIVGGRLLQTLGGALSAATLLDALDPPPALRAAAANGLLKRMRLALVQDELRALRVLTGEPISDELQHAVLDQLPTPDTIGDMDFWNRHRAHHLAASLDLLGADEAVRREAMDRILAYLTDVPAGETDVSMLVQAIGRLRPGVGQLVRALDLLLRRLSGHMDSWDLRALMEDIDLLLPPPPEAGPVLLRLLRDGGPWTRTRETGELLSRLVARAPKDDQRAATVVIHSRVAGTTKDAELCEWAEHLEALAPTAEERAAAVGLLVSRLPTLQADRCGYLMMAARTLRPTDDQRRELLRYLVHHISVADSADLRIALCNMATWFSPQGEARSAVAAAVLDAARSARVSINNRFFLRDAAAALTLTDEERHELVDLLILRLPAEEVYRSVDLAEIIAELGPDGEQRTRVSDALVARLNGPAGQGLETLVEVLSRLDASADWRTPARAAAVDFLAGARPYSPKYSWWAALLPDLALSDDDRRLIADALIRYLVPHSVGLGDNLALLDQLRPTPEQRAVIVDRLTVIMAADTPHTSAATARRLKTWPLTAGQRRATAQALIERVTTCGPRELPPLLHALAGFPLTDEERSVVTAQAIRHMETEGPATLDIADSLLALGRLGDDDRGRVLELLLNQIVHGPPSADETRMARLLRLGFDAAALTGVAHRLHGEPHVEDVLRDLARGLRHATDLASWEASLGRFADLHPPLYGTS